MIPPGPPQWAGPEGEGTQRLPSDSRLFPEEFWAWKAQAPAGFCRVCAAGSGAEGLFPLSAGQQGAQSVAVPYGRGGGKAGHTAFGPPPQCERVLRTRSRRPTPSRLRRAVVSKERISGYGWRCTSVSALFGSRLWKNCGSTPRFSVRLRRWALYQRSGAPGRPSGGRAGGCKQPRFTRGVKRSSHRTGPAPCTVCPEQMGFCGTQAMAGFCFQR